MIFSACHRTDEASALGEEAKRLLEQSEHSEALSKIRAARRAQPANAITAARLGLLEAEILIYAQHEAEALRLQAELVVAPESELAARQAMLAGMALRRTGRWGEAKEKLAWAIARALQTGDRATEIKARVQWAAGAGVPGHYEQAAASLQAAAQTAKALGDPYLNNLVRFNLASLAMKSGDPERATELFRLVAETAKRSGNIVMEARALDNMAVTYQLVGDWDRALDYNRRALALFDEHSRLPIDAMQAHGSRGRLLLFLDSPEEAVPELERALALARERKDAGQIRRWADNLVPALLALDRVDEAERLAAESVLVDPAWPYSLSTRALVHERRGRLAEARRDWEKALANPECPAQVRLEANYGLARLHTASGNRTAAERRFRATLAIADETRAMLHTDDTRLTFLNGVIGAYHSYATALVSWHDERGALRVEESSRARLLSGHDDGQPRQAAASTGELQRLAASTRSVLLAYWLSPGGNSHVRIIDAASSDRIRLGQAEPRLIARLVREHNEAMERQLVDPRSQGNAALELYRMLVAPVAARIPAGSRVVVIPDGALHRLNFETLVRVKDGRKGFWIEDVTLQVSPSLSLLEAQAPRPRRERRMLLIGDPLAAPEFPRLDHAADEMKTIREVFGDRDVTALAAEAATPSAYATSTPRAYSHIHFTAHAQAERESPLDSAVILSPEAAPGGHTRYRLLAREAASTPLEADLVTVSACRGAGNRAVAGEGMVGFAWAFLRAGAGNVVAGLWDVNDRSTAQLMSRMYAGIRDGKPPAEALRAAKLEFIEAAKTYAKPYYWAPFQIYSRTLPADGVPAN